MSSGRSHKLILGFAHWGTATVSILEMIETVQFAVSQGVDEIDCAPHYGNGRQENILGVAILSLPEDQRSHIKISTKVGRIINPDHKADQSNGFTSNSGFAQEFNYTNAGIKKSFSQSQLRLGLSHLHALCLHDLDATTHLLDFKTHRDNFLKDGYLAFETLKKNNNISVVSIGSNDVDSCIQLIHDGQFKIDRIMIAGCFNLLDDSALAKLFPLCLQHKIELHIAAPYAGGILSDPDNFFFKYKLASKEIREKKTKILTICEKFKISIAHAALQFVHIHPQVARVVVGARTKKEFSDTLFYAKNSLPNEFWLALHHEGLISKKCINFLTPYKNSNMLDAKEMNHACLFKKNVASLAKSQTDAKHELHVNILKC